jgi:predicted ArsR family transcriptional regulator
MQPFTTQDTASTPRHQRSAGLGPVNKAVQIRQQIQDPHDIDNIVDLMNRAGLAGGSLSRQGNMIVGIYDECRHCPIWQAGLTPSAFFCQRAQGLTKAVFEAVLGRPVEVEVDVVPTTDGGCRFRVCFADNTVRADVA